MGIKSPCVNICIYDFKKGFCAGCFRDIEDITNWREMGDAEKREALKRCKKNKRGRRC